MEKTSISTVRQTCAALILLSKRDLVLGSILALSAFFIANGIHIIVRGRIGPTARTFQSGKVLPYPSRLALAVLYLGVAAGLMLLVWKNWSA